MFKSPSEKAPRFLYLALLSIAGILIIIILIGTVAGVARSNEASPVLRLGGTTRAHSTADDDIRVFTGLGRLRIPLVNSSTLLLSIAFPYSASDITFTEELAAKINEFRSIAVSYFSTLPQEYIIQIDEDAAKQEILRRYNNSLRLGRIEALYFSDMLVIDGSF